MKKLFRMTGRRRNRTRRGPGRRGRGKGLLRTIMLITAMIAVPATAAIFGGRMAYDHLTEEKIGADYCYARADQPEVGVFIDYSMTHQISTSQRRDLVNTLMQTYQALPPNGRLAIFTTANGSTATISTPVKVICQPAETSAELAVLGAPSTTVMKLARQHGVAEADFAAFVDALVAGSTDQSQIATSSPILEQIQAISRYYAGRNLTRLVAYTDGLNNSPNGRFCAEKGELPRFAKFAERLGYRFVAPDSFGGAAVDVLLVEQGTLPSGSLKFCTNLELRTFWTEFFEANGAGTVRLTPLGYGAGR